MQSTLENKLKKEEKLKWSYFHKNRDLEKENNDLKKENNDLKKKIQFNQENKYFKQHKPKPNFIDNTIYKGEITKINLEKHFGFIKFDNIGYYFNNNSSQIFIDDLKMNKQYRFKLIYPEDKRHRHQAYILKNLEDLQPEENNITQLNQPNEKNNINMNINEAISNNLSNVSLTNSNNSIDTSTPTEIHIDTSTHTETPIDTSTPTENSIDTSTPTETSIDNDTPTETSSNNDTEDYFKIVQKENFKESHTERIRRDDLSFNQTKFPVNSILSYQNKDKEEIYFFVEGHTNTTVKGYVLNKKIDNNFIKFNKRYKEWLVKRWVKVFIV